LLYKEHAVAIGSGIKGGGDLWVYRQSQNRPPFRPNAGSNVHSGTNGMWMVEAHQESQQDDKQNPTCN